MNTERMNHTKPRCAVRKLLRELCNPVGMMPLNALEEFSSSWQVRRIGVAVFDPENNPLELIETFEYRGNPLKLLAKLDKVAAGEGVDWHTDCGEKWILLNAKRTVRLD